MDLSKVRAIEKADEGAWLDIMFVDGSETDVRIKLAGFDSIAYRDKQREISKRRIDRMQSRKRNPLTPEEIEDQATELLAACVLDWEGLENEGTTFPCNTENAVKLLRENLWIKEQVDVFVGDRSNFLAL